MKPSAASVPDTSGITSTSLPAPETTLAAAVFYKCAGCKSTFERQADETLCRVCLEWDALIGTHAVYSRVKL